MKSLIYLLFVALCLSCQNQDVPVLGENQFAVKFKYDTSAAGLEHVNALLFNQDDLQHKETQLNPTEGVYTIGTNGKSIDRIMFIAGAHGLDFNSLSPTLTACKALTTQPVDFKTTFPGIHFTAETEAADIDNTLMDIQLTRSVARLDVVKDTELDVVIESCVISNLIDRSYIFPGSATLPTDGELKSQTLGAEAFTNLNNGIEGIAYMFENSEASITVTFDVSINGIKNKLKSTLPSKIERNKKYEIKIQSTGAVVYTMLSILDWGDGGSTETLPGGFVPKIDLSTSILPDGIVASQTLDTLYIAPDYSGAFVLGLDAPVETEAKVESSQIGIAVVPNSKNSYIGNQFMLTVSESDINQVRTFIPMMIKSKSEAQYYDKHIVIVKQGYRTWFKGLRANFDKKSASWDVYKDGYIAEVEAWNDYQASDIEKIETRSDDAQFDWLLVVSTDGVNTVEGAFKVNDTEATGQEQRSVMTVTYKDGVEEVFNFTRKRNAIPVIRQGGFYWSKYNMRGNSKSYADQIGFDRDIPRDEFHLFLETCSDEDFLYYAGATYKGTSTEGLYLKNSIPPGGTTPMLHFEGYSSIPNGEVSNGPVDAHCPPGYQMPTRVEWEHIWATNVKLSIPANGELGYFNTDRGPEGESLPNRYDVRRYTRSITIDGVPNQPVSLLFLEDIRHYPDEIMVFTGLGNQSSDTRVTLGEIIIPIATAGELNHSVVGFHDNVVRFYRNMGGSGAQTRTIRCLKSKVNYIIE